MKTGYGLRRYFYEYVYYDAIERARATTGQVVPISQAKAIRRRVDELLAENVEPMHVGVDDQGFPAGPVERVSLNHPRLDVQNCLRAIDGALAERVEGYQPQYAGPDGRYSASSDPFASLQRRFLSETKVDQKTPSDTARLAISPYDPRWSERSTVKAAGTEMLYVPVSSVDRFAAGKDGRGEAAGLEHVVSDGLRLYRIDENNRPEEVGPARTYDDAAGLTALMDKMSDQEYREVRQWVIDGGRNPATGEVEPSRFTPPKAIARSAAVLEELKAQGTGYKVMRDRYPGQIKARIEGSGMEIRLTDPGHGSFAGARIYEDGVVTRYSTDHEIGDNKFAIHDPSPEEAVQLLRFAQGMPVERPDGTGRIGEASGSHRKGNKTFPDSYFLTNNRTWIHRVGRWAGDTEGRGSNLYIRSSNEGRTLPTFMTGPEKAESVGRQAVESARENLRDSLRVEELIEHAEAELERAEGDLDAVEPPEYSADPEIAAIQRSYWDVLTGARTELLRPGATEEMVAERMEEIGELPAGEQADLGNLAYSGSPADKVREHAEDVPFELVGTWDPEPHLVDGEWVDRRFDPARTAKYMTSSSGQWTNLDNLAAACRELKVPADELMGSGFQTTRFKDRLITFDPETAVPIDEHDSEFIRGVGETVRDSLVSRGTRAKSIMIDDSGVISWEGEKLSSTSKPIPVAGEIGQVFDVGDYGEVVTRFASGENATIVPGYEARIAAQRPGEAPKSFVERTVLRGYEQTLKEQIRHQIALDLTSDRSRVGEPAALNGVYSRLYGTKHPVDFVQRNLEFNPETGQVELESWAADRLATDAGKVRYHNEIKQGSTVYGEYEASRKAIDPADDNRFDAWRLTGGKNIAVLTGPDSSGAEVPGGYFDPVMTGGATNQGAVRYLTADAQVTEDGRIVPGDPETVGGSRAPLMAREELASLRYDPWDRQQMTASTIMQSSKVTPPTGTAAMTFGGWGADDGFVVSKEFAESHEIVGAGGALRPLVVGDKISDLHGNKGVISLIVDREMDTEEVREQGLEQEVAWFRANPDVDVVMTPFSPISRRNGGAARELMNSEVSDLAVPEGRQAQGLRGGEVGQKRFVVTHMAVDEKTKVYDEEQMAAGRGRKASSQLAWAVQAKDCPSIMREFYGHNSGAEANLREYLRVTGLDMEADGTLRVVGRHEPLDEAPERRLIEMPELVVNKKGQLNTNALRAGFGELIGDRGGDMEIPFPLRYPTGEQTEQIEGRDTYRLPVMSSHLRSGQEFEDGTSVTHDYTRGYQEIHIEACRWRKAAEAMASGELSDAGRRQAAAAMESAARSAQRHFESITSDVQHRVLEGKENYFKTGLMSSRLSDSATMVWSADPRLDVDQVALGPAKAEQLGLSEGDHALVWRDPVWRDSGVRYLRVAIDERLTGAAVNPVIAKSFDGDFDGDAVAVVKLHSEAAKAEAMEKFSMPANLVDVGQVDAEGKHPLGMHVELDTQVAVSRDPELAAEIESLIAEANAIEAERGSADSSEIRARQEDVTEQLSDFYRRAQRGEFGSAVSFASPEEHMESLHEVCVATGAKGSAEKLETYGQKAGFARGEDGRWHDTGQPGLTQADHEESMRATAIKTFGTGLGGSYSQRAVRALRDTCLKEVTEVGYPVNQSILQVKHSAAEGWHKYEMLQTAGRELWRGRKLERVGPGQWMPQFEDGQPVQASKEEWAKQFVEFYSAKDGFNVSVNPAFVETVAEGLADPKTGVMRNLEEDPALRGTPMDRLAYTREGNFELLMEAAEARESLFDGERNGQFASMPTRRAKEAWQRQLDGLTSTAEELGLDQQAETGGRIDREAPEVEAAVLKRDVLADTAERAQARGANRRSKHAVGVTPKSRPVYRPSLVPDVPDTGDDFQPGG